MTVSRTIGFIRCYALILLMDLLPRVIGLRRTLRLVRLVSATAITRPSTESVMDVAQRVTLAAAFYPRRALCLEQSLALYLLLRRRGVPAAFRLGARPRPFHAHAWVEVDGRPICESPESIMYLAVFRGLEA